MPSPNTYTLCLGNAHKDLLYHVPLIWLTLTTAQTSPNIWGYVGFYQLSKPVFSHYNTVVAPLFHKDDQTPCCSPLLLSSKWSNRGMEKAVGTKQGLVPHCSCLLLVLAKYSFPVAVIANHHRPGDLKHCKFCYLASLEVCNLWWVSVS